MVCLLVYLHTVIRFCKIKSFFLKLFICFLCTFVYLMFFVFVINLQEMNDHHKNQHYALDEVGNWVHVYDIKTKTSMKYYCPYCHQEMISKRGEYRDWHFAHKVDAQNCSYNNYLHTLAKHKIQEWYNSLDSIFLRLTAKRCCWNFEKCKCKSEKYCCKESSYVKDFDLKSRFPVGKLEMAYECNGDKFIPDILCEDVKGKSKPLFIEIYVTHRCDERKISSGIKIIEFNVMSEEDIEKITSSNVIKECELVELYNFHPKNILDDDFSAPVTKFILYHSKKYDIENNDAFTCKNYDKKRRGIYEITIPYDEYFSSFCVVGGFRVVAIAKAMHDKYIEKDCNLCEYYFYNEYSRLYECIMHENTEICRMFRLNVGLYEFLVGYLNKLCEKIFIDVWRKE